MVRGEIEWAAPTGQGKIAVPGNKITALVRRSMGKYVLMAIIIHGGQLTSLCFHSKCQ